MRREPHLHDVAPDVLPVLSAGPSDDPAWLIAVEGFRPVAEPALESWFTVANGRTGTRGAHEQPTAASMPATYVAGLFGSLEDEEGSVALARCPDWARLELWEAGQRIDLSEAGAFEIRRVLDLRRGVLFGFWRSATPSGRVLTCSSARFASMDDRAILAFEARVSLSPDGPLDMTAPFDIPIGRGLDAAGVHRSGENDVVLEARGRRVRLLTADDQNEAGRRFQRIVHVSRSFGNPSEARQAAQPGAGRAALAEAQRQGFEQLLENHRLAIERRWATADITISGDPALQRVLRFGTFHLMASADPECEAVSIGARGLSGPGYRGHVFWDTDVFIIPFFAYTHPPTARALLAYRYHTLPAARRRAAALGYAGALHAWESADTGDDVTPDEVVMADGTRLPVLTGRQEHHIEADIAWAAWRYWEVTGDDDFLVGMGAELIFEAARFWASRATRGQGGRVFHIENVIGPDEYHESVADNAFTNVMARWTIERGLEMVGVLLELDGKRGGSIASSIGPSAAETRRWRQVAEGLVDGFDPATELYEQFAGYFALDDLRAVDVASRPFAGELALGAARLRESQVIKQADVVMLAHMLPECVPASVARTNYGYYEPRCAHGSSLSPAIHAAVAARTGDLQAAVDYCSMAAAIDLGDNVANEAGGLHVATLGGLWQAAVLGVGGVRVDAGGLHLDPHVPGEWGELSFRILVRAAGITVSAMPDELRLTLEKTSRVGSGAASPARLPPGSYIAHRRAGEWSPLEPVDARTPPAGQGG